MPAPQHPLLHWLPLSPPCPSASPPTRPSHHRVCPVRLPQPISSLFMQIQSTETLSRCSHAPPERITLTWRNNRACLVSSLRRRSLQQACLRPDSSSPSTSHSQPQRRQEETYRSGIDSSILIDAVQSSDSSHHHSGFDTEIPIEAVSSHPSPSNPRSEVVNSRVLLDAITRARAPWYRTLLQRPTSRTRLQRQPACRGLLATLLLRHRVHMPPRRPGPDWSPTVEDHTSRSGGGSSKTKGCTIRRQSCLVNQDFPTLVQQSLDHPRELDGRLNRSRRRRSHQRHRQPASASSHQHKLPEHLAGADGRRIP